jgi:hypothetical protein
LGFVAIYEEYLRLSKLSEDSSGDKGGSYRHKPPFDRVMQLIANLFYALFILLENISVLSRLSFIKRLSEKSAITLSKKFWLLAVLFSICAQTIKLATLCIKEEKLMMKQKIEIAEDVTKASASKQR